jgi:hypothetical protein
MTGFSYLLGIVSALMVLVIVIEMLRKRKLRERHALWWLIAGIIALVAAIAPATLEWLASILGISVPTNLAFFISIIVLFLVGLQHSSELTSLEEKSRILAEETALLKDKVTKLENIVNKKGK